MKVGTRLVALFVVAVVAGLLDGTVGVSPVAADAPPGFAYSVRGDIDDQLYLIDLASGVANAVGPTGFGDIEGLTFNPTGTTLYGVDDATDRLVTIDPATGVATAVGPLGVPVADEGLTFDCAGNLWMSTDFPENLYRIDPATGAATLVGLQGQEVTGLASAGTTVYGLGGDATNNLVKIDTATGAATDIGELFTVAVNDGGIDFDASNVLWGIEDTGTLFTVNPLTGRATVQASTLDGFESLAITGPIACGDVTPPTCFVSGLFAGPPKRQQVTVQDTGSGLQGITSIQVVNGTVGVEPFTPGTTAPVRVTATKVNQNQATVWSFDAVDVAGNVRHCA